MARQKQMVLKMARQRQMVSKMSENPSAVTKMTRTRHSRSRMSCNDKGMDAQWDVQKAVISNGICKTYSNGTAGQV
jgi:hypothetical protein